MNIEALDYVAFSDGACQGNPGPGGWAFLLWDPRQKRATDGWGSEALSSNNKMEIMASIALLRTWEKLDPAPKDRLFLHSDSTYLIQGATQWRHGWKKKGWIKADGEPVANQDYWSALDELLSRLGSRVQWVHVRGHSGIAGNEYVDQLAVSACEQQDSGEHSYAQAEHPDADLIEWIKRECPLEKDAGSSSAKKSSKSSSSKKALGYLSLVDGALSEHKTWAECAQAVLGRPNARYRKYCSADEKGEILRSWGIR